MSKKKDNKDKARPNELNSKIEKLFIELPNYSFHHSSSASKQATGRFIGRTKLVERLKSLLVNTSSKTGVYLVAGNRGVGKSSLVDEVVKQTSVNTRWGGLRYALTMLLGVLALQHISYQTSLTIGLPMMVGLFIALVGLTFALGHINIVRKKKNPLKRGNSFCRTLSAAIKSLGYLGEATNPSMRDGFLIKFAFVLLAVQLASEISAKCDLLKNFNQLWWFFCYLLFVWASTYWRFTDRYFLTWHKKQDKENESTNKDFNPYEVKTKVGMKCLKYLFIFLTPFMLLTLHSWIKQEVAIPIPLAVLCSIIFILVRKCDVYLRHMVNQEKLRSKDIRKYENMLLWRSSIYYCFEQLNTYIKYHTRIYLKVNFGYDVLKEKDVLRLIARTIATEYDRYCKSPKRMLPRWLLSLAVTALLSVIFYKTIYKNDILPLIENTAPYEDSSQAYISDTTKRESPAEFFNPIVVVDKAEISTYLRSMDRAINRAWSYVCYIPSYFLYSSSANESTRYPIPGTTVKPRFINYAACLIFIMIYALGCFVIRSRLFNITTHRKLRRKLNELNEAITSEVVRENSSSISGKGEFFSGKVARRTQKFRMVADEREIEKTLQDILADIQLIPFFMGRPEFTIIFDELDKVEPERKESDAQQAYKTKGAFFSVNATRDRQSSILKLLSNLKYFLTTANAKFIFIAGREMYDIYLADTSDRNNFIGSIFNDVIYVPSFLSDHSDGNRSAITSLTEAFVCQALIPEEYPVLSYDLKSYTKYLRDLIFTKDDESEMKIQKIVTVLQQFIIYSAHLSKGAPKKLNQIFESFIESREVRELDKRFCVKLYRNTRFYLTFDYYDQLAVGMTAYIVAPIIYRFANSNIQEYSDKLLVSSLYFTDYLYKFHDHNFSWKNIDTSPEMIEVNKAPELRSITNGLVNFLTQIHIEKSTTGFYDFRFDNLISQEISFMSKTHEPFSAMYSFSLDESLALKQYYKELLKTEQQKYHPHYKKEYVHSISSLQIVLGDLYFNDDELEEASIYYKDGVQSLRQQLSTKGREPSLEQLLLLLRNMLKLGLTYEKRKQYDFAFLTYGELCKLLIDIRNFDVEELGLSVKRDSTDKLVLIKTSTDTRNMSKREKLYEKHVEPAENLFWTKIIPEDVATAQPLSFTKLSPKAYELLFKNSSFEGLKLLYLPFLAKFQILEKSHFGGITKRNIDQMENEFKFFIRTIDNKERNLLIADFYARVGDILFYKNGCFSGTCNNEISKNTNETAPCYACYNNKESLQRKDASLENTFKPVSCSACYYYRKALLALLRKKETDNIALYEIVTLGIERTEVETDSKVCSMMARIFSDWGDVLFSCDTTQNDLFPERNNYDPNQHITCGLVTHTCSSEPYFLESWIHFIDTKNILPHGDLKSYLQSKKNQLSRFEAVTIMYALSMKLYKRADLSKRSAFQISKILQLIKKYIKIIGADPDSKNRIKTYIERLSKKTIRSIYQAYDNLSMVEIRKRKNDTGDAKAQLQHILIDSEASRMKILVKEIELKLVEGEELSQKLREYYPMFVTSPYELSYSISARIYRLRLKTTMNWKAYKMILDECKKNMGGDLKNEYNRLIIILLSSPQSRLITHIFGNIFAKNSTEPNDKLNQAVLEYLMTDSIFCLNEIIRLSKTFGESYLFNHSYMATMYYKLADWVLLYDAYTNLGSYVQNIIKSPANRPMKDAWRNIISNREKLKEKFSEQQVNDLRRVSDDEWQQDLSWYYASEQALSHYYKCKETHGSGRAYHSMVDNLYYIKDDYNDRAFHFYTAMERYMYNTGTIQKRIGELKKRNENSNLHKVDNYFAGVKIAFCSYSDAIKKRPFVRMEMSLIISKIRYN